MADNDKLVEWIEDRLDEANDPRQDFLDSAAHAHYLFNKNHDNISILVCLYLFLY